MSLSSGNERKPESSNLDEKDIEELAAFFDLLARYDYEDARKEGRLESDPKQPSFDSALDASSESV